MAFVQDKIRPDGLNFLDPPFGRLQSESNIKKGAATAAPYTVIDEGGDLRGTATDTPHTTIAEGDDLASQWARMKEFGDEVNATGYEYHPASQNSNSFAAEALRRGGFFGPGTAFPEILDDHLLAIDPTSNETRPLRVPGFSARMKNPLNILEYRFRGWPRAADAGSIEPSQSTSDLHDNFSGAATNKPTRYLTRRIGSSPERSAYDTEASDSALPPKHAFVPGRPTTFDDRFANWIDSDGAIAPLAPHRPVPPAEDNRPLGIVSGKPMDNLLRPSIFGLPETPASDNEDWLMQLLAPRGRR